MPSIKPVSVVCAFLLGASAGLSQTPVVPRAGTAPVEAAVEISFASKSKIAAGTLSLGEISTWQTRASFVRTFSSGTSSAWLLGGTWQRFDFSPPAGTPIPESLTALAFKLGYNREIDARWSLRAEIDPGIYSDFEDLGSEDFNAPAGIRLIYAASRDLQWFVGVNVDWRSDHSIVGGPGLRWRFAPQWTLLLLVPAPRIEYAVTRSFTLFAAANLRGGTFRVAEDFGTRRGRPDLNNQNVSYRELSTGVGARWNLKPTLALAAGVGWMFDRRFEFADRDLLLNGDGAPTFQLSLNGAF